MRLLAKQDLNFRKRGNDRAKFMEKWMNVLGRLTYIVVHCVVLSAACWKTIVRHCRRLASFVTDNAGEGALTMEDAIEIVRLYCKWNMVPSLQCLLSNWRLNENAYAVINKMNENDQ